MFHTSRTRHMRRLKLIAFSQSRARPLSCGTDFFGIFLACQPNSSLLNTRQTLLYIQTVWYVFSRHIFLGLPQFCSRALMPLWHFLFNKKEQHFKINKLNFEQFFVTTFLSCLSLPKVFVLNLHNDNLFY